MTLLVIISLMPTRVSAVVTSEKCSEPGILDGMNPTVEVISPTESASFIYGLTMTIEWTASDSSFGEKPIKIELKKEGESHLITESTENDSSFDWIIEEIGSGLYQVAITAIDSFGNSTSSLSDLFYILGKNMDPCWYVSKTGDDQNNNGSSDHPYLSIQRALDECADGDTVFVDSGVYQENINTLQKSAHIISTSGSNLTVIDGGSNSLNVVTLDSNSTLSGFTVQNSGQENAFVGGINVIGGTPLITNNVIINNNNGVICWGSSAPIIQNNLVAQGNALVLCQDQSAPRVVNNTLIYGGEGINIVSENATVFARNNIIAYNSRSGGITSVSSVSAPDIRYNNVWNNQPANYSGIDDLTGIAGNLSVNPLFQFPDTLNVQLLPGSACINAGDPSDDYANEPEPNGDCINMGCYGNTSNAAVQILGFTNDLQLTTYEDSLYQQLLELPYENNVQITVTVDQIPDWLLIDQNDSLIYGIPNNSHVGSHVIRIFAEDNFSRKDTLEYQLMVVNTPPDITSSPLTTAWEETQYSYDVDCSDDGQGDIRYHILEPAWLTIDSISGLVAGIPQDENVGLNAVIIEVLDGNGGITLHSYSLLVKNVNDSPVLSQLPDLIMDEDQITILLFNDWESYVSDIDNDFSELLWRVENGNFCFVENFEDSVKFIPQKDWYGEDSMVVIVSDSTLSDTSFFRLIVNPLNDYAIWSLPQDTSLYFGDSLIIDLHRFVHDVDDPDSNLNFSVTAGFNCDDYHLSITINDNRILKILPRQNIELINGQIYLSAVDTSGYQACDTVSLSVYKFNFPPELTQLPDLSGYEDVPISVDLDNWLTYVTDRDDSLKYLSWYVPGSDNISTALRNDTLLFYPAENWYGSDSLKVSVLDEKDTATVEIVVTFRSVADPPQLALVNFRFCEDETLTVQLDDFVVDVDTPDSLLLWSVTYEKNATSSPIPEFHHTLDPETRELTFWGDLNFFIDSVRVFYSVTDDSGLTSQAGDIVTITPVNDPPVVPNVLTYAEQQSEDIPFSIDLVQFNNEIYDVETPFQQLGFYLYSSEKIEVSKEPESQVFNLISEADWFGRDTLKLDVSDDSCTVSTYLPIYVHAVNDLPVVSTIPDTSFFEDDSLVIDLRKYVYDIDTPDDSLKFVIIPDGQQSVLYAERDTTRWRVVFRGIADGSINNVEIIYQVWDTPDSFAADTNYISIIAVNDPPFFSGSLDTSYYEDEHLVLYHDSLLNYVYDIDNDKSELTLDIISDSGLVLFEHNQLDNYFRFHSGKDIDSCGYFTIKVSDPEGAFSAEPFIIDIISVNDAPVLFGFPDTNIAQNNTFIITLDSTVYNDVDNDESEITWSVNAALSQVLITQNEDSLICQPPVGYVGWDTIYISITDPEMLSDRDTFRIHFDDTIPPTFTIGIFQNPIASEHINLYFFPSEPVDTIRSILISGKNVEVEIVTDIIPNPYYTNYQLVNNVNQQIIVAGTDTSGNTGQTEYIFSASFIGKRGGGTIYSPDSSVQLIMGHNSVSANMFVLCLPNVSDTTVGQQKSKFALAKSSIVRKDAVYDNTFKSPQDFLKKNCKIIFDADKEIVETTGDYPGIFRFENGSWIYLKTFTDDSESRYWSYIDRMGRYTISGNAPQPPEKLPSKFSLGQNYPNPYNALTTFTFELPELSDGLFESMATLSVYNILGQKVTTIINKKMIPGRYSVQWNSLNQSGHQIASGIYFYTLHYGPNLKTRKMILLK